MTRGYIAFADYHVPKILNGEKWLTVRYDWDREPGNYVDLVDGNREKFGMAKIVETVDMTIEEFVERGFDGHMKYDSPEHMVENMETFYNNDLSSDTEVTVISFGLVEGHG